MEFISLLLIAVGLAMDSVTVSVSCGLILMNYSHKNSFQIAFYMGFLQGVMPVIGFLLGSSFRVYIEDFDHWIALLILVTLGGKMIYEYFKHKDDFKCFDATSHRVLFGLGIATSIDALAVGITFSLIGVSIITAGITIALVTFVLSYVAVYLANKFRQKMKFPFALVGGIILIIIGVKIFIEHIILHGYL